MIALTDMTFSILIFSRWQYYEISVTLGIVKCDQCQNTLDLLLLVWFLFYFKKKWILGYFGIHDNLQKMKDYTRRQFQENIRHDRWQIKIPRFTTKKLFIKEKQIKNLASIILCTAVRTWPNYWSFGYQWCRYCLSYLRRPESDFSSYATIRIKINTFVINNWQ